MIKALLSFPASSYHPSHPPPLHSTEIQTAYKSFLTFSLSLCCLICLECPFPEFHFTKLHQGKFFLCPFWIQSVTLLWANTQCPLLPRHLSPCLEIVCLVIYGLCCLHFSLFTCHPHCLQALSVPLRAGTVSFISEDLSPNTELGCRNYSVTVEMQPKIEAFMR